MESKKSLFVSFKKYLLDSEFLPYLPLIQLANLEILENILNSVGQTALPLPHWKKFRKYGYPHKVGHSVGQTALPLPHEYCS
jgi:hypothetical protein